MEKKKLISLCNRTHDFVGIFYKIFSLEKTSSKFSNWNARDTLGHILFWMDHCGNKIYHIKKGLHFELVDANKANEETYMKNKNVKMDTIFESTNDVIFNCINVIDMFTKNELLDKTFQTGFDFELWRYIAMDMYIHPVMHLLHYYLKLKKYEEFNDTIKYTYKNFLEYSNNNMEVFNFNAFYENEKIKIEQFSILKRENIKDEIKKIIEINIK
jgi:hypothetical protein